MEQLGLQPMKDLEYTHLEPTDDGKGMVDSDGKIWQPLNSKQKRFIREYLKGESATQAAIKAGYTKNRNAAKRQGSVLLNHNPVVRNHLIDQSIKLQERSQVNMDSHLSALYDLREEAKDTGQLSAAITAEVHRGKAGGLYVDRREVIQQQIQSMPKEEIIQRLEQLIQANFPKIIEAQVIQPIDQSKDQ